MHKFLATSLFCLAALTPAAAQDDSLLPPRDLERAKEMRHRADDWRNGAVVYQAAVYGSSTDPSVVAPFFEALRLPSTP